MTAKPPVRLHAIYAVLDDVPLFRASIASIYDHVDRITVITTHDRDWMGEAREPSALVATVLGRDVDPERKIDLIVTSETNEGRARNRAMDYAAPRRASLGVRRQHALDAPYAPPDYFLIIDADEIYEAADLDRLLAHVGRGRRPVYRVPCVPYFKSWNYRVEGYEWAFAFVRADWRIDNMRGRKPNLARRALAKLPGMPDSARWRLLGFEDVAPSVGVFHHGSYVGPRTRIAAKLGSWGHAAEVVPGWLETCWDRFTPDARDFHPTKPAQFAAVQHVPTGALPQEIGAFPWPAGYLE